MTTDWTLGRKWFRFRGLVDVPPHPISGLIKRKRGPHWEEDPKAQQVWLPFPQKPCRCDSPSPKAQQEWLPFPQSPAGVTPLPLKPCWTGAPAGSQIPHSSCAVFISPHPLGRQHSYSVTRLAAWLLSPSWCHLAMGTLCQGPQTEHPAPRCPEAHSGTFLWSEAL